MNRPRVLAGLGLVALGVLWLLDALGVIELGPLLATWWPLAVVAWGASQLLERPPHVSSAAVMTAIGLVLLSVTTGLLAPDVLAVAWPLALVAVGVWLLVGRRGRVAGGEATVSSSAVFSGRELAPHTRAFEGGSLTALFGGVELDLRRAGLAAGGARLDVTALFGGVDVLVPAGWRVRMRGPVIFGGATDDTARAGAPEPDGPVLELRLFVLFGGVEVKARSLPGVAP